MKRDWHAQALFILEEAARSNTLEIPTIDNLAKTLGVNRSTIWRNKDIHEKYNEVSASKKPKLTSQNKPSHRRNQEQKIFALKLENDKLQKENEQLLQNFIIICRKLTEKSIDPFSILGKATPTIKNDIWKCEILPWDEP